MVEGNFPAAAVIVADYTPGFAAVLYAANSAAAAWQSIHMASAEQAVWNGVDFRGMVDGEMNSFPDFADNKKAAPAAEGNKGAETWIYTSFAQDFL